MRPNHLSSANQDLLCHSLGIELSPPTIHFYEDLEASKYGLFSLLQLKQSGSRLCSTLRPWLCYHNWKCSWFHPCQTKLEQDHQRRSSQLDLQFHSNGCMWCQTRALQNYTSEVKNHTWRVHSIFTVRKSIQESYIVQALPLQVPQVRVLVISPIRIKIIRVTIYYEIMALRWDKEPLARIPQSLVDLKTSMNLMIDSILIQCGDLRLACPFHYSQLSQVFFVQPEGSLRRHNFRIIVTNGGLPQQTQPSSLGHRLRQTNSIQEKTSFHSDSITWNRYHCCSTLDISISIK